MLTIQPQYLTLSKLLDGRLFRIPEYQRAYSWTSRERGDLFGDIERTHSKGSEEGHFMAAVVCLRRKKQVLGTDEFFVLEVVDGQQRLTTLIILLNAIGLAGCGGSTLAPMFYRSGIVVPIFPKTQKVPNKQRVAAGYSSGQISARRRSA